MQLVDYSSMPQGGAVPRWMTPSRTYDPPGDAMTRIIGEQCHSFPGGGNH